MEREVKTHQLGQEAKEAVGVGMGVQRATQQTDGFQVRVGARPPNRRGVTNGSLSVGETTATWPGGRGPSKHASRLLAGVGPEPPGPLSFAKGLRGQRLLFNHLISKHWPLTLILPPF